MIFQIAGQFFILLLATTVIAVFFDAFAFDTYFLIFAFADCLLIFFAILMPISPAFRYFHC